MNIITLYFTESFSSLSFTTFQNVVKQYLSWARFFFLLKTKIPKIMNEIFLLAKLF